MITKNSIDKIAQNANAIIILFEQGRNFILENIENDNFNKKDRQLDNLIDLVENHTRTERHLEQYSEIGDPENKENARMIQEIREEQMEDLKRQIKGENDIQTAEEQLENLKERYENTLGYIAHNEEKMSEDQLQNLLDKQENRKIQMENLEDE